ncbi:MAG: class I SAM-dependent methyltransferase [Halieaceae bacterium]
MSIRQAKEPASGWVQRFQTLVPEGGQVLDLACGGGRQGRLFLSRGHPLVLLDRDVSKVADLRTSVNVEIIEADLEAGQPWPLPGRSFAAVVVSNYLHRPLFPHILASVAAGGLLIYETFAVGNEKFGRPSNPDFLLKPEELLDLTRPLMQVIAYEELEIQAPRPAKVQRVVARMKKQA